MRAEAHASRDLLSVKSVTANAMVTAPLSSRGQYASVLSLGSLVMRMTVLGGGGAWPTPERGCSGYLVEAAGFRLLIDPGHAILPVLLQVVSPSDVDAVIVTHGHADYCADLNPLLRARHLSDAPPPALPVYALSRAADAVLTLDGDMLTDDFRLHDSTGGELLTIGPFAVGTQPLQHFVHNVGVRVSAGDVTMAYAGDGGSDPSVADFAAAGAQLLLCEATFPGQVPAESAGGLSTARRAGQQARAAGVDRLLLTHLWPGVDPDAAASAARLAFDGPIFVAMPLLQIDLA